MTDVDEFTAHTPLKIKNGGESELKRMDSIADAVNSMTEAELVSSYDTAKETFALVMRNKVAEALELSGSKATTSMFHSLAVTGIALAQAYLTLDPEAIEFAMKSSGTCVRLCYQRRRKSSITDNTFTKTNKRKFYDEFTEVEIHAELCYAQCQALRAFSTLIRDDKVLTFLKAGFRFRLSYQSYKLCQEILTHRTVWNNEYLKREFECGVAYGIGTYNVILSSFPKRFQKIFEFIGFSAKFDIGEGKLEESYRITGCLMQLISCLTILGYHLVFCTACTRKCGSLDYVETVLDSCLKAHPESTTFVAFAARLAALRGNTTHAIKLLEITLNADFAMMANIKHIAHWELAWCRIMNNDLRAALPNLATLCEESNWSKLIFNYTQACVLATCPDLTEEERPKVALLIREANKSRMCFAGKDIPLEKELSRKCDQFFQQGNWLMLPLYELMYIMNYFSHLNKPMVEIILASVESALLTSKNKKEYKHFAENHYLAVLLKGACFVQLGKTEAAEECFKEVVKNHKKIKETSYVVSCANMELGFIYMDAKKPVIAKNYLKEATKNDVIWAEFRIRRALEELKTGKIR